MADKVAGANSENARGNDSASNLVVQEPARRPHSAAARLLAAACLLGGIATLDWLVSKCRSFSQSKSANPKAKFPGNTRSVENSDTSKTSDSPSQPHPQSISLPHELAPKNSGITPSHDSWIEPRPQNIPRPTYSPAVLALAVACLLWGLVTTYLISLLGVILFAVGLAGWIGELRHEHEVR